jgi:hypothetical protein
MSCGTVGSPVAPEDVGVNVKRQKDSFEKAKQEQEALQPKEQDERALPIAPEAYVPLEQQVELTAPIDPAIRPDSGILIPPR